MFFSRYLKFIGFLEILAWAIGLFFILPLIFVGGIISWISVFYASLYIIFAPAVGVLFYCVGHLMRVDAEEHNYYEEDEDDEDDETEQDDEPSYFEED